MQRELCIIYKKYLQRADVYFVRQVNIYKDRMCTGEANKYSQKEDVYM